MAQTLLTLDLLTITLSELQALSFNALPATAEQARHMYNGHHLGAPTGGRDTNFAYWRGPMVRLPAGATEADQRNGQHVVDEFQTALRRSFTSTNYVKETVRREVSSSVARMSWTLMQTDVQRQEPDKRTVLEQEADALAGAWWRIDRNHPERAIRQALRYARREGRGVLRFRVAGGAFEKQADGKLAVKSFPAEQLLRFIRLECLLSPENVLIAEDPDTFTKRAAYSYKNAAEQDCMELSFVQDVDGKPITHLRILRGAELEAKPTPLELGGRITYIELEDEALITQQFLQNQMAYNTASTMVLRNTELAGFLERYGINIEPPYDVVPDPDNPGKNKRVYKKVTPGAGAMVLWRGSTHRKTDAQGKYMGDEPLGKAQYGRFEPVSPDSLMAATSHFAQNMYSEVAQSYVLMGKDATASGRSREVAISDFDIVRQTTVDLAEDTVGQVLEVFLALIAALTGRPGRYESIQVEGSVKSRIVPPSPEDRTADREDVAAGIISKAQARQRQGDDNPDQTEAQIQREQAVAPQPQPQPAPQPAKGRKRGRKAV